jgi:hypothetical protein
VAYDNAVLNKKAKHSQCSGVYWIPAQGKWRMVLLPIPIQFRPRGDRTKSRWGCWSGCS